MTKPLFQALARKYLAGRRLLAPQPAMMAECALAAPAAPRSDGRKPLAGASDLSSSSLVVDDEAADLTALEALLTAAGAHVRVALSVQEALDAFHGSPPDVLVADLSMPGTTRYALIRHVRSLGRGGDVPAVVVSGSPWEEHQAAAIGAGFNEWVSKTSAAHSLVNVVARLAGRLHD